MYVICRDICWKRRGLKASPNETKLEKKINYNQFKLTDLAIEYHKSLMVGFFESLGIWQSLVSIHWIHLDSASICHFMAKCVCGEEEIFAITFASWQIWECRVF